MIQKNILQLAKTAMKSSPNNQARQTLREIAIRMGRNENAVHKASNMRLAQWARNRNSPI